jgi:ankyrin repeat protein
MQTAFHLIAKRNRHNFINLLISSGANINARDSLGRTPLYIASKYNSVETVKILLFELADPFLTPNDGKSINQVSKNFEILSCVKHAKAVNKNSNIASYIILN